MEREIVVGTILMEDRPAINSALEIESDPFFGGWGVLKPVGAPALAQKVFAAGWSVFSLAGEAKVKVFGRRSAQNDSKAVRRLLKKVGESKFNCLEITRIAEGRFLGMPYTIIGGHSRHIQQEWFLQDIKERSAAQEDANWARG